MVVLQVSRSLENVACFKHGSPAVVVGDRPQWLDFRLRWWKERGLAVDGEEVERGGEGV